jgi:ATP-binding cassette subfamily B multidrug efflux pump
VLKILKYIKPFRISIILSLILLMLRSLADLYLPTLTADIVNIGIVNSDVDYILKVGCFMIGTAAFAAFCNIVATYISAKAGNGFSKVLRDKVFTQIESFSLHEFDQFGTASLITRTTNDITQIRMVMNFGLRMMIIAPIMCIGSVFMAFSRDTSLASIFVLIIPILGAIIYFIMQKGSPLFAAMQNKLDTLNLVLRECLTGVRVIRAFNRDSLEEQRFKSANMDYFVTSTTVNRIMGATMPLGTLVINIAIIAIVWFGSIRITTGNIQVGDLMALIQYAMHVMSSLVTLTRVFIIIPRASASAARISEVLETVPEIRDPEMEKPSSGLRGHVEFKNVTFSYPGAERPALNNISFSAKQGQVTAVIGSTGSGKSTLASLILRLYDVDKGSILINSVDVREMTQETLRRKISYVPQKALLFSGTVWENITYGKEDASLDEVEHVLRIAQAKDFIHDMKEGLKTVISQGGKNVSGGQRQRLTIARALIRKPEIYIFDDSFSALDFRTEAMLRTALYKEAAQSTVFITSQRVSTVMHANQIIVLEDGNIEGIGNHEELMETCEVYREIVESQFKEEKIA